MNAHPKQNINEIPCSICGDTFLCTVQIGDRDEDYCFNCFLSLRNIDGDIIKRYMHLAIAAHNLIEDSEVWKPGPETGHRDLFIRTTKERWNIFTAAVGRAYE
ncbi:hypothetical protein D4S03_10180 [bacterium]|nr:MAG: hypothetical protein D4S03_10180 [bacterium]